MPCAALAAQANNDKIRGIIRGAPRMRIIIFGGMYWGLPFSGPLRFHAMAHRIAQGDAQQPQSHQQLPVLCCSHCRACRAGKARHTVTRESCTTTMSNPIVEPTYLTKDADVVAS